MQFNELDVVRLLENVVGEDAITDKPVTIPQGEVGTVVVGDKSSTSYDVEFLLTINGKLRSAIAIVPAELLVAG